MNSGMEESNIVTYSMKRCGSDSSLAATQTVALYPCIQARPTGEVELTALSNLEGIVP